MKLISYISGFMTPFLLFYVVGHGLLSKRDIYSDFLEGAKEGLKTVKGLIPVLIGLMTAVGVLRASGFLDFLGEILGKVTSAAGYSAADRSSWNCKTVFVQRSNRAASGHF